MLKKITVENFKGFDQPTTLDLSKPREYGFNPEYVRDGIVNKALIYGKNGCGKTNIGLAIFDITQHLADTYKSEVLYRNYLNYKNRKPAVFDFLFQFGNMEVEYSYAKSGCNSLLYEKMLVNGEIYLEADYSTKQCRIYAEEDYLKDLRLPELDPSLSLVKFIYSHSEKKKDSPITLLMQFVAGMLWFRTSDDGRGFIGLLKDNSGSMDDLVLKSGRLAEFQEFLHENSVDYKLIVIQKPEREVIGVDFEGIPVEFSDIISTGTRSLWLYFAWSTVFKDVTFLFLDEFDAFYHYESSECVLANVNHIRTMQTIVTSHNTSLMNNRISRPDCCFIMTDGAVRALCDCTDKEIREAHNLEKMYRNGAFTE